MSVTNEITPGKAVQEQVGGFTTEVLRGGLLTRVRYGSRLQSLLATAVRKEVPTHFIPSCQGILNWEITSEKTTIVLLKKDERIVGFTSAYPATRHSYINDVQETECRRRGMSTHEFAELQDSTAEFGWTFIDPQYRGQGGWSLLMNSIESQITQESKGYTHMIRYVRQANAYADKVARRYQDQIVYRQDFENSPLGPQVYYRIRLRRS